MSSHPHVIRAPQNISISHPQNSEEKNLHCLAVLRPCCAHPQPVLTTSPASQLHFSKPRTPAIHTRSSNTPTQPMKSDGSRAIFVKCTEEKTDFQIFRKRSSRPQLQQQKRQPKENKQEFVTYLFVPVSTMRSLSWVPSPTQPPRTKCSRSSMCSSFLALGIYTTDSNLKKTKL